MFRLKIKFGNRWKDGITEYATFEEAEVRVLELKSLKKNVKVKIVVAF